MRQSRTIAIVAIVCVGGWMATALAQGEHGQSGSVAQSPGVSSGGQAGHQELPLVTGPGDQLIQGQIVKIEDKKVNDQEHRFVHLKTKQGQMLAVDLGLEDNLPRGFEARENQWVLVAGKMDRVGDQQVFVAHTFANVFNLTGRGGMPATERDRDRSGAGGTQERDDSHRAEYRGYGEGTGTGAGGQTQYEHVKPGQSDQYKSPDKN